MKEKHRRPNGYWTDDSIVTEIRTVISEIGHFPTHTELNNGGRSSIAIQMHKHGGIDKFREIMGYTSLYKQRGYWNEETIVNELNIIINKLGHFPLHTELKTDSIGLSVAIYRNGGINYFRKLLGYPIEKRDNGYWNDETIIQELKPIIDSFGYFPTHEELSDFGVCDLIGAMVQHGGSNRFRNLLNYPIEHREHNYWNDNTIISELKEIINEIGHFPTQQELRKIGKTDISNAIARQGKDINTYRSILNAPITRKQRNYWTDDKIVSELKKVINTLHYFPTKDDLINIGRGDLTTIERHGGYNKFRQLLGYNISLYEQYRSESASYTFRRGRHSEKFVKKIITEWTINHGLPEPQYNVKLSQGNVIEFVCNTNKTIGIDVTNTATKYAVTKKWRKKDYYKYLDELWIVVFSDVFTEQDYIKWNSESPDNVKVMSIIGFLEELDYSTDESMKDTINKLESCTFRSKNQLMNKNNGVSVI